MKDSKRVLLCAQALDDADLRAAATKLRQVADRVEKVEQVVRRWIDLEMPDAEAIRTVVSIVEGRPKGVDP